MATTQPTTHEADVRAFAREFPTRNVLLAVSYCERGDLTWAQVHDLFCKSTAKALATVSA